MISPYLDQPVSRWLEITQKLVESHPLKEAALRDTAMTVWALLWQTTVGTGEVAVKLSDLRVPATIVGYFFEVLFARELQLRAPEFWRGNMSKDEKDLVYIPDPTFSVEIKASGQCGLKVYGNRSYGQKQEPTLPVKKEKSGFYITVNFFDRTLTLIRFGWIDASDWDAQEAPTGQMAGLKQSVYDGKLLPLQGAYRQHAPVRLLEGVGDKSAASFAELGIITVGELIRYEAPLPARLAQIKAKNQKFIEQCLDS
jgi:hypothetical protein